MSELQEEDWTPPVVLDFTVDYQGECVSLTGRSTITYQAGRDPGDPENRPQFRLWRNSGKGMFAKDWILIEEVDALIARSKTVTARTMNDLYPGRSINCGGFALAVLKDLGVLAGKDDNTRHHEHVPGTSMLAALSKRIADASKADRRPKVS